jgi:hypothetical protein
MKPLRNSFPLNICTPFFISGILSQIALAVSTMYSLSIVILFDGKISRLYMESRKFSVLSASVETVPLPLKVLEIFEETQVESCAFP